MDKLSTNILTINRVVAIKTELSPVIGRFKKELSTLFTDALWIIGLQCVNKLYFMNNVPVTDGQREVLFT